MITINGLKIEAAHAGNEIVLLLADTLVAKFTIPEAEAVCAVIVAAIQRSREERA